MDKDKIKEKAVHLIGSAIDRLFLLRDSLSDRLAILSFFLSLHSRPRPSARFIALTTAVVGIALAQAIVSLHKSQEVRVASAHESVLGASTERVRSARNPDEFVERAEVYHAAMEAMSKEEALKQSNVTTNPEDVVQFVPDPSLGLGSEITVIRATPTMIDNGGSRFYLRTFKTTVKELLDEQGVTLGEKDTVDPALDSELWWGGRVVVTRVEVGEFTAVEDIRYDVETREDANKFKDEVRVIREGKRGKKEVTAFIRRENGEEVEKKVLAEKILSKPVTKIEVRGTKFRPANGRWEDLINEIAPKYYADPVGLTTIMMCESGGNIPSYNPAGPYYGMFQFDEYTFTQIAGHSMSEIEDARAQIDGAAKLYSARYWHWPVCSKGT